MDYPEWVPSEISGLCNMCFSSNKLQDLEEQVNSSKIKIPGQLLRVMYVLSSDPEMEKVWKTVRCKLPELGKNVRECEIYPLEFVEAVAVAFEGPSPDEMEDQTVRLSNLKSVKTHTQALLDLWKQLPELDNVHGIYGGREVEADTEGNSTKVEYVPISGKEVLEDLLELADELLNVRSYMAHMRGKPNPEIVYFVRSLQHYVFGVFGAHLDETIIRLVTAFYGKEKEIDRQYVRDKRGRGYVSPSAQHLDILRRRKSRQNWGEYLEKIIGKPTGGN